MPPNGPGSRLEWKAGLVAPARFHLWATPGAAGAAAARMLYRPRRPLARAAGRITGLAIESGLGRAGRPPGADAAELCEHIGIRPDGGAVVLSRRSRRRMYAFSVGGRVEVVVKVGRADDTALAAEHATLARLDGRVGGVLVPCVRWFGAWREHTVLATDAMTTEPDAADADIEEALDVCLSLAGPPGTGVAVVHGDLAPWNLLRTPRGIALVDWETSRFEHDPLFDLAHFVVSTGSLLGWHDPRRAVAILTRPGSPGWRYLDALDLDPTEAPDLVRHYLRRMTTFGTEASRRYRGRMLAGFERTPVPAP
jgi:hypothetical protein